MTPVKIAQPWKSALKFDSVLAKSTSHFLSVKNNPFDIAEKLTRKIFLKEADKPSRNYFVFELLLSQYV